MESYRLPKNVFEIFDDLSFTDAPWTWSESRSDFAGDVITPIWGSICKQPNNSCWNSGLALLNGCFDRAVCKGGGGESGFYQYIDI